MYPSSGPFKAAIWQPSRSFERKVTITTTGAEGRTIVVGDVELMKLTLRDSVTEGTSLGIGTAVCRQLDLTLNNMGGDYDDDFFAGATIVVETRLNEIEWIPMGVFYVDEAPRPGELIDIVAFDGMIKFDRWLFGLSAPTSPAALLQRACEIAGVTLATGTFLHSSYTVNEIPDRMTCRQVVQFVAQLAGCFARINRTNQLTLKWYTATTEVVPKTSIFRIQTEETVTVTGVEYEHDGTTYVAGEEGYVVVLRNNPLISTSGIELVVAALGNALIGTSFVPGRVEHQGNPCWDAGDIVTVTDAKNVVHQFSVGENMFNLGAMRCTTVSAAESKDQTGYASGGELTRRLSEIRRIVNSEIASEVTARELAIENVTNLFNQQLGGFVLKRENELLIMDSEDPELATKIWRWSLAGLAYSDNVTGADNPGRIYTTAITMDGTIVANFITTGVLDAGIIQAGTLSADRIGTESITISKLHPSVGTNLDLLDNAAFTSLASDISVIEARLDGATQLFYGSGAPTLSNYPANGWTTNTEKDNHIGDRYLDDVTGYMYRFVYDATLDEYKWIQMADADVAAILAQLDIHESQIQQNASNILLRVTKASYDFDQDELDGRISLAEASISLNADNILLRVSKDGVISSINQSAEEIKIQASKIDINGAVTFSSLDGALRDNLFASGTTEINGGNIRTGTIEVGSIKAGTITADRLNVDKLSLISDDIGTITAGHIDAGLITSGTMVADRIFGGQITGVEINVDTIATIGEALIIDSPSFNAGIEFRTGGQDKAKVYIDPAGGGLFLHALHGGVYANGVRLDTTGELPQGSLDSIAIYNDGLIASYGSFVLDWSFVKDGSGRITSITNNNSSKTINVSWHAGSKP